MICEKCKIREATIRFTEIVNGEKNDHYLCQQCARELNLAPYQALVEGDFPLQKLLSGLLGLPVSSEHDQRLEGVVCPTCGMSYKEFVESSQFGCADCYHAFDMLMGGKIRKLQDNASHTGKHPKMRPMHAGAGSEVIHGDAEVAPEENLRRLKRALQDAVRAENYEAAVELRDQIRLAEDQLREAERGDDHDEMV